MKGLTMKLGKIILAEVIILLAFFIITIVIGVIHDCNYYPKIIKSCQAWDLPEECYPHAMPSGPIYTIDIMFYNVPPAEGSSKGLETDDGPITLTLLPDAILFAI